MADDEIWVHHLDVTRHSDVAGGYGAWASCRKLKTLWTFALHLQRDLLDVQNNVSDIFTHASKRRKFMQYVFDLDRSDRCALQR